MKSIEQIKSFTEEKFKRTFGVNRQTFDDMLKILEEQYKQSHKKGGRPSKVTMFDRLCIFFAYYRDYRTMEDISNDYSLAVSTTCDIIKLVEETLIRNEKFHLPSKRELNKESRIIIDATECEIEKPKKSKENIIQAKRRNIP